VPLSKNVYSLLALSQYSKHCTYHVHARLPKSSRLLAIISRATARRIAGSHWVIANDSIGVRMLNEVQLPEQLKARRLQGHFSCDSELMNARVQQVLATSRRSIGGHDNHVADSRPRVALRVRDDVQQFANCRAVLMQG